MKKLQVLIIAFLISLSICAFTSMQAKAQSPPTVSVSPTSWTMDVGQTETFTATPSGGSGNYASYQWSVNSVVDTSQIGSSYSFAPASAGSYSITVTVTDSNSLTSAPSSAATVTVNSALVAPTVTSTPAAVDQNQTSTLSVPTDISGGTGPFSYQWMAEVPGGSYSAIGSATSSAASYIFNSTGMVTGIWSFELQVTDTGTGATVTSNVVTVTVNATPTATPTAAPTATPTAAPTAAPTATPTPVPSPTATPTVTPTLSLSFLLIVAIAVAVIVIVGAVSAFFVTKRRVTEKSLRKSSPRDFQDWVIKRFKGKPSDPTSGVDGYTAGGQPLLIKQSDNVSLAEVEGFVSTLNKTGAQRGAIVAFNYDKDAADGKMKALDQGIELEMLSIYQLMNKRFSDKIENIASTQVALQAPREAPGEAQPPPGEAQPPVTTEDQGTVTFGGVPIPVPNEPQTDVLQRPVVFVSYSNTKILDQVTKLLQFLQYDYAVGDNEETPVPMSENKFGLMKNCDCAVIIISAIEQERRYSGIYVLNTNVLTEISAAYLKYYMQIVLVVERKVELPSNLKGLFRIEYDNDDLSFDAAMELEKILADFKKI